MSEVCEQDYYDYARAQTSPRTPDSWGQQHWKKRDRDYVVEWKLEQAEKAGRQD